MNIQLLVNGKYFPMIVKPYDVTNGAGWTKINAPTLTRAESAALDEHVGDALLRDDRRRHQHPQVVPPRPVVDGAHLRAHARGL